MQFWFTQCWQWPRTQQSLFNLSDCRPEDIGKTQCQKGVHDLKVWWLPATIKEPSVCMYVCVVMHACV